MENIGIIIEMLYNINIKLDELKLEVLKSDVKMPYKKYFFEDLLQIINKFKQQQQVIEEPYISDFLVRDVKLKLLNRKRLETAKEIDIFQLMTYLDLFVEFDDYKLLLNGSRYNIFFYDKSKILLKTFKNYDYEKYVIKHFENKHSIEIDNIVYDDNYDDVDDSDLPF